MGVDVFILLVRTALEPEVSGSDLGDCVVIVRFNQAGLADPGLADDSDLVTSSPVLDWCAADC
jgi:hypothetical protein